MRQFGENETTPTNVRAVFFKIVEKIKMSAIVLLDYKAILLFDIFLFHSIYLFAKQNPVVYSTKHKSDEHLLFLHRQFRREGGNLTKTKREPSQF